MTLPEAWIPVVVVVVGVLGGWVTNFITKPGSREDAQIARLTEELRGAREEKHATIDQLQEDRNADRERLDRLAEKIEHLEEQVSKLLTRDTLWGIHVAKQDGLIVSLGGVPLERPKELQ